jgi:tRNA-(ms[2]io[6]A)-hydroxylase
MIRLAREELLHFQRVCKILQEKGIALGSDEKDPYIQELLKLIRHGRDERLLDRLLVFGIVEARGTERFRLLGQKLQDLKLRSFYAELADAEERHHELFTKLALKYFPEPLVSSRIKELVACESEIVRRLPLRAAVH